MVYAHCLVDFRGNGACLEYSEPASLGAEFIPCHVLVGHAGSLVQIRVASHIGNDAFCQALGGVDYFVGIVLVVVTYFGGCALCERISVECKPGRHRYGEQSGRVEWTAAFHSAQYCVGNAALECHVWRGVILALASAPLALGRAAAGADFAGVCWFAPTSRNHSVECRGGGE